MVLASQGGPPAPGRSSPLAIRIRGSNIFSTTKPPPSSPGRARAGNFPTGRNCRCIRGVRGAVGEKKIGDGRCRGSRTSTYVDAAAPREFSIWIEGGRRSTLPPLSGGETFAGGTEGFVRFAPVLERRGSSEGSRRTGDGTSFPRRIHKPGPGRPIQGLKKRKVKDPRGAGHPEREGPLPPFSKTPKRAARGQNS